ncbi:MAG: glycosyltransferase [Nodosilinea sp. LVE1205-7]
MHYLAISFSQADWAGIGGPNLPPPEDGPIAACVANAPGGPIHVLISDREAEHIPGCNMAFWVDRLRAINGFDPRYRAAGDDVDICWRLQNQGWKIGFSPAALVWHHRRNSVKAYWKQQKGYGKAEALLEIKWPERYNALGHLRWNGRLYGRGLVRALGVQPQRIYHGVWGSAPFQSLYEPAQGLLSAIPAMPEWYLIILLLIGLAGLDWFWSPELWVFPLLLTAIAISLSQAAWSAAHARFSFGPLSRWQRLRLYGLTTLLYCMQPLARLWGRLDNGLTPWRRRRLIRSLRLPLPQQRSLWSEQWHSAADWILAMVQEINHQGIIALYGDDFSAWDLEIRGGLMGSIQVLMAIEEHGAGKQLLRFRCWPKLAPWRWSPWGYWWGSPCSPSGISTCNRLLC